MKAGNIAFVLDTSVACSAWVLAQLGETSAAASRLQEGERLLERQAASGFVGLLGSCYRFLGHAAFALGRLDDAQRLGERALAFSSAQHGFAADALHLLADVAAHPDRFDAERAAIHYREALALAEPRGMRPLVGRCHLGLGSLGAWACASRRASTSPPRPLSIARWTCRSGSIRPRRNCTR